MALSRPLARPIVALKFINENDVFYNSTEIDRMLNHCNVKDRKIVVFSIVGSFRKGKSFFLDYCLRFLYAHYSSVNNPQPPSGSSNWMGEPNAPLKGFSWRSGRDRDTTGIVMWSDIFLHTIEKTGEKLAILVIDTQGLFDDQSGTAENFKIFALSSLLSSMQVLNIMREIDENHLQHLNFATDFANCLGNNQLTGGNDAKAFQKLTFLLRDFPYPGDYPFGMVGGTKYINEVLNIEKTVQNQEVLSVRQHINNAYEKIECCLLPHPGNTVCENKSYDGRLSEMSDRSKVEFKNAIEHLLMPNNLIPKRINGIDLTGSLMRTYLEKYFQLINSNNFNIKSFAEGTIDNYMNELIKKCAAKYELAQKKYEDIKEEDNILEMHNHFKQVVLEAYDNENKMGNQGHIFNFKDLLKEKIKEMFIQWKLGMISIAKEKKKTLEAEEARQEEKRAREAAEKKNEQMTTMMALSCATNVLSTGLGAFGKTGNLPLIIPSSGSNMMPNVIDMVFNLRDRLKRNNANEESITSKKVFDKVLSLSTTDDSDKE
ncbi:unnamed protein product [Chironomus riparius]|uniref:GB1/RHD3-type G domain-containing protein n=1 Tax=Chironomus riparius TaxID=315576 RepID=A0A9N9RPH1_9DIPT|nr:unnamed protein product [Chironomus riparius]